MYAHKVTSSCTTEMTGRCRLLIVAWQDHASCAATQRFETPSMHMLRKALQGRCHAQQCVAARHRRGDLGASSTHVRRPYRPVLVQMSSYCHLLCRARRQSCTTLRGAWCCRGLRRITTFCRQTFPAERNNGLALGPTQLMRQQPGPWTRATGAQCVRSGSVGSNTLW